MMARPPLSRIPAFFYTTGPRGAASCFIVAGAVAARGHQASSTGGAPGLAWGLRPFFPPAPKRGAMDAEDPGTPAPAARPPSLPRCYDTGADAADPQRADIIHSNSAVLSCEF